jgi:hypothetical protein
MIKEELLRPRIKCVIRYPCSPFPVGAILEQDFEEPEIYNYTDSNKRSWMLESPELYPETFKRLQWWEDREGDEPPKYIKSNGIVYKADKWSKSFQGIHWLGCLVNKTKYIPCEYIIPATAAEYEAYLQTTNQLNNGQ